MCERKQAAAIINHPCTVQPESYTEQVRVEMRVFWPDHATVADVDHAYQQAIRALRADYQRAVRETQRCTRQAS